jgi:hypothetical protein
MQVTYITLDDAIASLSVSELEAAIAAWLCS